MERLFAAVGSGGLEPRRSARLRAAMARLRRRAEYHRQRREVARGEFDRSSRRVRFLELSPDAEVTELVEAHRQLLGARNALDHHQRRLRAAEDLAEMMRSDHLRLEDGREPEHREAYATEVDG